MEQLNILSQTQNDDTKLNVNAANFRDRLATLSKLSYLAGINHLMKDNLCYYNVEDVCVLPAQLDVFNEGLVGAFNQMDKLFLDHQPYLMQDTNTTTTTTTDTHNNITQYYASPQYRDLILYGNQIIYKSHLSLLTLMNDYFDQDKADTVSRLNMLYLGIGVPLVFITIVLGALEVYVLRRKVKRIMFALTYLPTFKF